ncbi:MBL fold metallo-hydrolase [Celerinatantimonas yamalensis]|uniref:MBL fold metallo-hydrolase n=1 Tax=Celerinatantimonas yamalensis TaxID=559956 RepID=A0ABW9GAB5_9GAMM
MLKIHSLFDHSTHTASHVVYCQQSGHCAIIDPVLDLDPLAWHTHTQQADKIIHFVQTQQLAVQWILETHVHADHLTAASYIKSQLGGQIGIGNQVTQVQEIFKGLFNAGDEFHTDGQQFDHLFADGDTFPLGDFNFTVIHTPGHTPACVSYTIDDAVFVGDTLFMPDYGTARCDFPGGDASDLYQSIQRLYQLSDDTRVFLCHDYLPEGREQFTWETTIGAQKQHNIHIQADTSKDTFVTFRQQRDETLTLPELIMPSIQVNMRAGELPPAEDNGIQYLKFPLNRL